MNCHVDGTMVKVMGYKHRCQICQKSLASTSSLNAHIQTHSGEKPFDCFQCNQSFGQLGTLDSHKINKHSDGKHVKCPQCGKGVANKNSLERHKKIHNNEVLVECPICKTSQELRMLSLSLFIQGSQ